MKPLSSFQQVAVTRQPAPIHKLDRISKQFGLDIFVLRDDLNGFAFGGNKNRKLNYLVADALSKGCDMLIGIGAQQSNFCRLAAAAGAYFGLEVHLVVTGKEPEEYTGNLLLDRLLGAKIHFLEEGITKKRAWELEQEFLGLGRRPYRMPSGGSTGVGSLGYVEALAEIITFEQKSQIKFDKIIHATGSGGTQAGLVAGQTALDWKGEIIGMSVGRDSEGLAGVVEIIANQTLDLLEISARVESQQIIINDQYVGPGYGKQTPWGTAAIDTFAKLEGIFLDHVYSGKGAAGLLDYINSGKISPTEKVLFIHTGGNVELFA